MALYISRSSIESYQRCPRYRYLHDYSFGGKGIVPTSRSIPLTTGTCIHRGIEHLLSRMMLTDQMVNEQDVDNACVLASNEYVALVEKAGFYGRGVTREAQQEYTFGEQKALTEALIRVWSIVEAPNLIQRFRVTGVEREIVVPLFNSNTDSEILLQVRVDGELQDRRDSSYYNYSLKTSKRWDEKSEKGYKKDLQGLTEIYAVEQSVVINNELVDKASSLCKELFDRTRIPKYLDIATFIEHKKQLPKKIMGVKFCFLIKGVFESTERNNPVAIYHTRSSLIRGYRNISPSGVDYAASLFYPNPENKSGWGRLGKGWEEFDVWSDPDWSVKKWIDYLSQNQSQNMLNALKECCVTPIEYFRDDKEIAEELQVIKHQEECIKEAIEDLQASPKLLYITMIDTFPRHRGSCHYPINCEYNAICWPGTITNVSAMVSEDPIGSGLFQVRVPHHKAEKDQMEGNDNG